MSRIEAVGVCFQVVAVMAASHGGLGSMRMTHSGHASPSIGRVPSRCHTVVGCAKFSGLPHDVGCSRCNYRPWAQTSPVPP
jgi:hypothetical protein